MVSEKELRREIFKLKKVNIIGIVDHDLKMTNELDELVLKSSYKIEQYINRKILIIAEEYKPLKVVKV